MIPLLGHLSTAVLVVSVQQSAETLASASPDLVTLKVEGDKEGKTRCKYQQILGSKIPKRVCMTEADWKERERIIEEELRALSNRNSSCGSDGPC
tara:strand:- start:511 stop:795 length:285 start_codon:yes stop_codon:yes gene_type:complete